MAGPATIAALLLTGIENLRKAIAGLEKSAKEKNDDKQERLTVRAEIALGKTEIQANDLVKENNELREELKLVGNMVFDSKTYAYWRTDTDQVSEPANNSDGTEVVTLTDGPYCVNCLDNKDRKAIHLGRNGNLRSYICPTCKNTSAGMGAPPSTIVPTSKLNK
jgi:hypothetical protein